MSKSSLAVIVAVAAMIFVVASPAGAVTNGPTVLHFRLGRVVETTVGYSLPAPPPVGSQMIYVGVVYNTAAQFGKPIAAPIGRILVDCTTLTPKPDGLCTGIVHVPNGFFTIVGSGPFTTYTVDHYGVAGGVGPYATARGEMTNIRSLAGGIATVTFSQ